MDDKSRPCTCCGFDLDLSEYPLSKGTRDGRGSVCKACISRKAKEKRDRFPTEHSECVGFLNWFKGVFNGVLIFHIPNGMKRDILSAKILKEAGVVRGIPDYFIPSWNIWVEMKRQHGGSVSREQKVIHQYLEDRCGHTVIVAHGARDASAKLAAILRERRERQKR